MDSNKKKILIISTVAVVALILVFVCFSGRMKPHTVESMKECLISMDYYSDNMVGYSLAGISDMGGLMKNGWTIFFYDYGKHSRDLDEMITLLEPELDSYTETKGSNYIIYENENQYNYCLIVRVENTLLELFGPKEQKEEIRNFASYLGYYRD